MLRASALIVTAWFAVASGCVSPPPSPPSPPPAPPEPPPVPTVVASAEIDAGSPAPEPQPAHEIEHRIPGPPGSTRGTIACGTKRCDATKELCALLGKPDYHWGCAPRDNTDALQSSIFYCDDGTDCPQGKTCCMSFGTAATYYVCTTRDDDCSIEVCEPGGARCPAGLACRDGFCKPADVPGPRCGSKRCKGDTPVCHWENGKGECISNDKAAEVPVYEGKGGAVLRCTSNADCGAGFSCCTGSGAGPRQSYCTFHCDAYNTMHYCDSIADCPKLPGVKWRCGRPDGVELPSWSKLCLGDVP